MRAGGGVDGAKPSERAHSCTTRALRAVAIMLAGCVAATACLERRDGRLHDPGRHATANFMAVLMHAHAQSARVVAWLRIHRT